MKDAENKFIKFLEEKGVLEEYKAKFANNWGSDGFADFKDWIKLTDPYVFILSAFSWSYVNEKGYVSEKEKWSAINKEWQVFIKKDGAE